MPEEIVETMTEKAAIQAIGQAPASAVIPVQTESTPSVDTTKGTQTKSPIPSGESPDSIESLRAKLNRERQLRRTLEGRLKSQLKPANEENKRLKKQLDALQAEVEAIRASSKPSGAERLLTDQEKETLGEDVIDINQRIVNGILEESLESNGKLTKAIQERAEELVREKLELLDGLTHQDTDLDDDASLFEEPSLEDLSLNFWDVVDQYVPNASKINASSDPRWIEFLGVMNRKAGITNGELARSYYDNNDPEGMAGLFRAFKRVYNIGEDFTVETEKPSHPETVQTGSDRASDAGGSEPEYWTEREMIAFYSDLQRGKFKGREAEARAIEARINDAVRNGRIR